MAYDRDLARRSSCGGGRGCDRRKGRRTTAQQVCKKDDRKADSRDYQVYGRKERTLVTKEELRSTVYWWGFVVSFGLWVPFYVAQVEETFVWWDAILIVLGSVMAAFSSWFSVALLVGGWMFGSIP